jgi:hypothetical protein
MPSDGPSTIATLSSSLLRTMQYVQHNYKVQVQGAARLRSPDRLIAISGSHRPSVFSYHELCTMTKSTRLAASLHCIFSLCMAVNAVTLNITITHDNRPKVRMLLFKGIKFLALSFSRSHDYFMHSHMMNCLLTGNSVDFYGHNN